jgi:hypothetical protein
MPDSFGRPLTLSCQIHALFYPLQGGPAPAPNPKGIESVSLGLRESRYPGSTAPAALTLQGLYRPRLAHLPRNRGWPSRSASPAPLTPDLNP